MNIIAFSKTLGRFTFSLDIVGGFAFGLGFSFFPNVIAFGFSLGPLVVSVGYREPNPVAEPPRHVCASPECGRS